MLLRFSLYGFLKNQRYFEPFLLLALLDRGLSFTSVGLLVAFRGLCVNLLEIPSGAAADLYGRRRAMILSFTAYIAAFTMFGWTTRSGWLWPAMALLAVGDSLRTGTHKAMIFAWLRSEGRTDERTAVYGFTRSWSKLGSAFSVLAATAVVWASDSYALVFQLSAVPYVVGIVNFLGYPPELDGERQRPSLSGAWSHLRATLGAAARRPRLRRLVLEGTAFGGAFEAVRDYLQPLLLIAVAGATAFATPGDTTGSARAAALAVGPAYCVIYLSAAWASRKAHRVAARCGGEDRAAWRMWQLTFLTYLAIGAAIALGIPAIAVVAFAGLHVLQNIFRPVLVSRFDQHALAAHGATVLSLESQASRAGTMLLAPLVGWLVDTARIADPATALWPIGAVGALVTLPFMRRARYAGANPRSWP